MSEKRFTLTDWHEVKDNGRIMTVDEVIDMMNNLYEENQLLQRDMSIVHNKNKELMLENENLKHWNRCLAEKRHKEPYLGKLKSYYCKADPIWVNDRGEITSKSREKFPKGETND